MYLIVSIALAVSLLATNARADVSDAFRLEDFNVKHQTDSTWVEIVVTQANVRSEPWVSAPSLGTLAAGTVVLFACSNEFLVQRGHSAG